MTYVLYLSHVMVFFRPQMFGAVTAFRRRIEHWVWGGGDRRTIVSRAGLDLKNIEGDSAPVKAGREV